MLTFLAKKSSAGWMDGWVDGWVGGSKSRVEDCLQQSKTNNRKIKNFEENPIRRENKS